MRYVTANQPRLARTHNQQQTHAEVLPNFAQKSTQCSQHKCRRVTIQRVSISIADQIGPSPSR